MSWSYEIKELYNGWHKVIYNSQAKTLIAIVDNLDKEFVMELINNHNNEVSFAYKDGITARQEIIEEIKNKKL